VQQHIYVQGSNKMGPDPEKSVVSLNFRVWDRKNRCEIPNLYVVDSSVFPASVGANPMQSIYSMAKLFVDQVI
jgi:choline dehydrogenase-like flavoprotein